MTDLVHDEFAEEVRRQSRLLWNDPHEQKIMEWIEATADRDGWVYEWGRVRDEPY